MSEVKIKNVSELLRLISQGYTILMETNGIKYNFDNIRIFESKLSDIMTMIADERLYYKLNS